jgi:hypothetical protein
MYDLGDKEAELTEESGTPRKAKKQRSPSYPWVDLETALERAGQLYTREHRNFAPIPAILEAWGYAPKSSGGMLTVAALKRFGLLEDRGSLASREARVTELAQAILLDDREDATERSKHIQAAAMMPPIHSEIWAKYEGKLPSDSTLRYHLTVDRGFTKGRADEFIEEFRKTLRFSGFDSESGTVPPNEEDKSITLTTRAGTVSFPPTTYGDPPTYGDLYEGRVVASGSVVVGTTGVTMLEIPVPVGGGFARLLLPASLTEDEWAKLLAVLTAYKPMLVKTVQLTDTGATVSDDE